MYAWNASPVDGTNIIRSIASIGREFPFPLDLQPPVPGERASLEGQQTLDHFDAMAPLIAYQRELFQILVKERRSRHRELRNAGIKARRFNVGDLVMVRKQVKSDAKKGISAKLLLRPKGVYRVIAEANPGSSYWLQRLPFCQGLGVPGKIVKQKSSRMERLPSVVVLSRMAEGADSRFAQMNGPLAESPLAKWLKVIDYGTYRKAPGNANFAYDAADDLWPQPDDDDDDDDEDDDDDDDDDDENENDDDDDDDSNTELPEPILRESSRMHFPAHPTVFCANYIANSSND